MTNRLALITFVLIAGFFLLDALVLHLGAGTYVSRKLFELIHYLKFWR